MFFLIINLILRNRIDKIFIQKANQIKILAKRLQLNLVIFEQNTAIWFPCFLKNNN